MTNSNKISIIVPVYNSGKHLIKCLDSIINQTYRNLEIILVDDGSFDDSDKVCDDYQKKDNRIKVIHQNNLGVSRARNVGIDIATGDYYHFPDSDDYLELNTYEQCIELISKYGLDAVVFEHYITYSGYEKRHSSPKEYYRLYEEKEDIIKLYFRAAFTCNKIFDKKLIKDSYTSATIKFHEDIFRGEDSIFSREVLFQANRVFFTNKALYHYVQSEQSACRGDFRPSQLSLLKAIDINKGFFKEYFPQYLPRIEKSELESCITLYKDMYSDNKDYMNERMDVFARFKERYATINRTLLSNKQKIKLFIFCYNPILYCILHNLNIEIVKTKNKFMR